jgi:MFS family permease
VQEGEIGSRQPLATLSSGALAAFVSGRERRSESAGGRRRTAVTEQEPVAADRTGIVSLLTAEAVGQVGNMMVIVGGLLFGPINPLASTVIQEHTPPQMLGRVFGALTALAQAGIPIGAVLAGFVVQDAGLVPTILGMGAIYLVVTLAMFFNRPLHQMDAIRQR